MRWRPKAANLQISAVMLTLSSIIYGEFLCHWIRANEWPSSAEDQDSNVIRILLVADPQLVGIRDEPSWPLGALTRWDLDRYLSKTFRWALSHIGSAPDAVVFLGDLIDEGSTTMDEDDYWSYVDRFYSIYPPESAKQMVFVSGDNDVGGEGSDPVTKAKVDRFRRFFPEKRITEVLKHGSIVKLVVNNYLTAAVDDANSDWMLGRQSSNSDSKRLTLLFSHLPILDKNMRWVL